MMRYVRSSLAVYLLLLSQLAFCQMRYAIAGAYNGKSAQGMSINEDRAYLFSHGGRCRVFNLITKEVEREFLLESADSTNHVNNACFANEFGSMSGIPLIYISECKNGRRCFVERINESASVLLQTIVAVKKDGKVDAVLDWIVDPDNGFLYAITRNGKELKTKGIARNYISKYRLPKLEEGSHVVLTEKNRTDRFEVIFPNILQGAKIRDNLLYIVTGLSETASNRVDAHRAIQVIDLKKRQLVRTIDLTYVTTNEPEDIDFYNGKCLLYCGQNGGIYEVNLK